ncbi:thioredoxin domain-containing protein [Leptolyngbya sp. FACHB-17]|uniref:DsbA family protein n=1 Tax=unclassified Leptolyngbya TaxID=2650499 RepID=UPI00167FFA6A|nr:thioredoxin domain-containing protein [Leptolyngbya sp. FACHB-17]MBD2082631.1 DsbA family protein [Leptolyngbya sp. FACHB-17]
MADDHEHHSLLVPPSIQDHTQGVLNASVVLIMYGDYECFQSANAYRLIKAAQQQLSSSFEKNDVCFIFRHFPQIQIHPHAQRAAEAAEAAAMQGQFWQMHEMLFIHQQALENGYLVEYANRLGLDIPRFLQDLSKGVYVEHIIADIQGGYRSGVEVAPALFVNEARYRERRTVEQLIAAIVAAIN